MNIAEWNPLNKEQAEELFSAHAVLLGERDAIPVHIAAKILPSECVDYINSCICNGSNGGLYWNTRGLNQLIPDGMVRWLTRAGFLEAITWANALYYWPEQRSDYMKRQAEWDRLDEEEAACKRSRAKKKDRG